MTRNTRIDWEGSEGVLLLDALNNCTREAVNGSTALAVYGRGIIVGLVAALMFAGFGFDDVWEQILHRCPQIDERCIPKDWPTLRDYNEVIR